MLVLIMLKENLAHLKQLIAAMLLLDTSIEDELLFKTSIIHLAHGQILFNQGELAHSCFLVISGNLKIVLKMHGAESTLTILSKGEFGGALLMGSPPVSYPASVVALTQASLLIIPKETYVNYWTKNIKILNFINNSLQNRMRQLQEDKVLQLSNVEDRVTSFLYRHYIEKQDLISKKITRKDIALAIGAKTETVIRTLKKLENLGAIKTNKSVISILNESYFNRNS